MEILESKDNWILKDLIEERIDPHFENVTNLDMWKKSKGKSNKQLSCTQSLYLIEELTKLLKVIPEFREDIIDLQYCYSYVARVYKRSRVFVTKKYEL